MPCYIYAVTAMNEDEISDKIGEDMLDGIAEKPVSFNKLQRVLIDCNFIV
jgi:hypothetical protein